MTDLLLTHGYFLYEDAKELQILKPYRSAGNSVYLLAPSHERVSSRRVRHHLFTNGGSDARLTDRQPVGAGNLRESHDARSEWLKSSRLRGEAGWKTVVGGPEPGAYVQRIS